MTFLKWIQRPCPTKLQNSTNQLHHILLKICCFNNYSEFPCAGSWGLWSNFTQAPLNRWDLVSVFQNWSFFGKMEIQAISVRPWPNFSTPTPFDSAPLFVTSYKPPWLHKKSPGSWHWFDWVCHAVAHECQDSKVTLISKPNQSCSLLTEKVPAASWTAPSLQHSSSADSWIARGGIPSFFVFFRTCV